MDVVLSVCSLLDIAAPTCQVSWKLGRDFDCYYFRLFSLSWVPRVVIFPGRLPPVKGPYSRVVDLFLPVDMASVGAVTSQA
jgi:hypothetical protein